MKYTDNTGDPDAVIIAFRINYLGMPTGTIDTFDYQLIGIELF